MKRLLALLSAAVILAACSGPSPGGEPAASSPPSPTAAVATPSAALSSSPTPSPTTRAQPTGTPTTAATPSPTIATPTPEPPTATPSPIPPTATPTSLPPTPTAGAPTSGEAAGATDTSTAFSADRALQHVIALSDGIGPRVAGSAKEAEAAAYLESEFRKLGYEVAVQRFPLTWFEDRGSTLHVVSPQPTELHPVTLLYSATGEVTAPLVRAGLGRQEDFPPETRGNIALVQRGSLRFREIVANAAAAGAAAVVIYNNLEGNFGGGLAEDRGMPVVAISREEGDMLLRLMEQGEVRVRVRVDAATHEGESANVVATKRGRRAGTIVIGGHYDSVPRSPGANDNASGTATVLELARVMAQRDYPFTLQFVAFGAEEVGLIGSQRFVQRLSAGERREIIAMFSLDMVGVGEAWRFSGTPFLVRMAQQVADERSLPNGQLVGQFAWASDHTSFVNASIPGLFVHRIDDPRYHSSQDTSGYVDPQALSQAASIVLAMLDRLSGAG